MKRLDLLDVNVWLALGNPWHVHHAPAQNYWADSDAGMAFCRISLQGFLRLLTQPAAMGQAVHTPKEAWDIYNAYLATGRVEFLPEPVTLDRQMQRYTSRDGFHASDWTDVWLASFAVTAGCRMVSFDAGFGGYGGLEFLRLGAD